MKEKGSSRLDNLKDEITINLSTTSFIPINPLWKIFTPSKSLYFLPWFALKICKALLISAGNTINYSGYEFKTNSSYLMLSIFDTLSPETRNFFKKLLAY